ncbi:MAG: MFS transporter [Kordiimonadaceae bacterium]|nr:MFS transporter [Kordiimonadaceae bacterium]MBT6031653.1 MFS transporter [Kordiimonadaceae bacterium]
MSTEEIKTEPDEHLEHTIRYAWFITALLMLCYTFSMLDREIISLLVEPIKAEFGITDFEMGLLMGPAFSLFYTFMGIPLGWAADRYNRKNLITIGITIWSIMTAFCGLAGTFMQLFITRIGVGVGEASLTPSASSMLSDLFPKEKLPLATSVYSLGVFIGSSLAMIGGGILLSQIKDVTVTWPIIGTLEYWQLTFIIVGLPGLILAIFIYQIIEPKRKGLALDAEGQVEKVSLSKAFAHMWQNKKLFLNFFLGGSIIATIGYHSVWYPSLFMRTWGWSELEAATATGLPSLIGGVTGLVVGGIIMGKMIEKGRKDAALYIAFIAALGIGIPAVTMPLMPTGILAATVMIGAKLFVGIPLISGIAMIRMSVPNQMRGQFTALYFVFIGIVATGIGPVIPGFFTTFLFNENTEMIRYSLAISAAIVVPIGSTMIWFGWQEYKKVVYAQED